MVKRKHKRKPNTRYKPVYDVQENIRQWDKVRNSINEYSNDSVKLESLAYPNIFSPLLIHIQHFGRVGNASEPSVHYPKYYYLPKNKHEELIKLLNSFNVREQLHPIFCMIFASMCIAAADVPKFEYLEKHFENQDKDLKLLLDFLADLKNKKKDICTVQFKYHDLNNGQRSSDHYSITIKGISANWVQSLLGNYENDKDFQQFQILQGIDKKRSKELQPYIFDNRSKKISDYANGIIVLIIYYQIRGYDPDNLPTGAYNFNWPSLSEQELKKYKLEDLYLLVGRLLELSGLIIYKPTNEEKALKNLSYDVVKLIDVIRKKWAKKPKTHHFPFGYLIPV